MKPKLLWNSKFTTLKAIANFSARSLLNHSSLNMGFQLFLRHLPTVFARALVCVRVCVCVCVLRFAGNRWFILTPREYSSSSSSSCLVSTSGATARHDFLCPECLSYRPGVQSCKTACVCYWLLGCETFTPSEGRRPSAHRLDDFTARFFVPPLIFEFLFIWLVLRCPFFHPLLCTSIGVAPLDSMFRLFHCHLLSIHRVIEISMSQITVSISGSSLNGSNGSLIWSFVSLILEQLAPTQPCRSPDLRTDSRFFNWLKKKYRWRSQCQSPEVKLGDVHFSTMVYPTEITRRIIGRFLLIPT